MQITIYAFSLVEPETLDTVQNFYALEDHQEQKTKPVILVGLDRDLVEPIKIPGCADGTEEITRERIDEVARAINAVDYVEWIEGDAESDAKLLDTIVRVGAPYANVCTSEVREEVKRMMQSCVNKDE